MSPGELHAYWRVLTRWGGLIVLTTLVGAVVGYALALFYRGRSQHGHPADQPTAESSCARLQPRPAEREPGQDVQRADQDPSDHRTGYSSGERLDLAGAIDRPGVGAVSEHSAPRRRRQNSHPSWPATRERARRRHGRPRPRRELSRTPPSTRNCESRSPTCRPSSQPPRRATIAPAPRPTIGRTGRLPPGGAVAAAAIVREPDSRAAGSALRADSLADAARIAAQRCRQPFRFDRARRSTSSSAPWSA